MYPDSELRYTFLGVGNMSEERILKEVYFLSQSNHHIHLKIPFELSKSYSYLKVHFRYEQQKGRGEGAEKYFAALMPEFFVQEEQEIVTIKDFLPVCNLLTLSIRYEGNYLGFYHQIGDEEEIILSQTASSLGFRPSAIVAGEWEIQVNQNYRLSEAGTLKIEVVVGGENTSIV